MASKVYFIDFRASYSENLLSKFQRLLDASGFSKSIGKRDLVALKIHFGEYGNTAFIRPVYIRQAVKAVKKGGGVPFLTDANTLYAGSRGDSPSHLETAITNGFDYAVTQAPLIIADGLRGATETAVEVKGKHISHAYIGSEIIRADSFVSIAHFKGHELTGFGGALKNVGMGCASRKGKMVQHAGVSPRIDEKKCIGCGICARYCVSQAIEMRESKPVILDDKCTGCAECILICEQKAIKNRWNQSIPVLMETMVEYCAGVLKDKKEKSFFINFINHISPACDCAPYNDVPVVHDIGIVASEDPVAIDQASADLVNDQDAMPGSCIDGKAGAGSDKFRVLYPDVDWEVQLEYARKIGLGSRDYKLVKL